MFTKGKEADYGTQPAFDAPKESTVQKPKARVAPSIFSADLTIDGSLKSDGDVQFDGKIEGSIRARSLTVGEEAVINGEIVADDVTIRGRVLGSIRSRKVHLASTSHVEGDIFHNALGVESGAFFQGNCRHVEDPMSSENLKEARAALAGKQDRPGKSEPSQPATQRTAAA